MQDSRKKSIRKLRDTSLLRPDLTQRSAIPKEGLHVTSLRHIMRVSRPNLWERKHWETNPNKASLNFGDPNLKNPVRYMKIHKWKCYKLSLIGFSDSNGLKKQDYFDLRLLMQNNNSKFDKIALTFSSWETTGDEGMTAIVSLVTRNQTSLKRLLLDFNHCDLITGNGIIKVATMISSSLTKLEMFRADFYLCSYLGGKEVQPFVNKISRSLANLKHLFLNFGGSGSECGNIHDEDLKMMMTKICTHIPHLQRLSLYLWMQKVTNKGLKEFGSLLCKHLQNLKTLSLIFRESPSITSTGFLEFCSEISQNRHDIRKLCLIFSQCDIRSDAMKKAEQLIRSNLKKLVQLDFKEDLQDEEI